MVVENAIVTPFFFRPVFTFRPYGAGNERGWRVFYQHSVPTGRRGVSQFKIQNSKFKILLCALVATKSYQINILLTYSFKMWQPRSTLAKVGLPVCAQFGNFVYICA
jgi:hypothetical protein